jgi:aspartate ammonia-lyase
MDKLKFRIESDSIGEKEILADAYYGINAVRGAENFGITGRTIHKELVIALAQVKKACAISNFEAGIMTEEVKDAIVQASEEIIEGKLHDQFICDPIQGGAGTTANMNANEVIANRANEILGGELGVYDMVSFFKRCIYYALNGYIVTFCTPWSAHFFR